MIGCANCKNWDFAPRNYCVKCGSAFATSAIKIGSDEYTEMIIKLIESRPNRRDSPLAGDLTDYNYSVWFDGGAVIVQTGSTEYHFLDGSIARVPTLPDWKANLWFKKLGGG